MAAEREQNLENFKKEGHSAFVIGYTGEIGKVLVKELDEVKAFKRVVLVGRRQTNITQKLGAGFVRHFDKNPSFHILRILSIKCLSYSSMKHELSLSTGTFYDLIACKYI